MNANEKDPAFEALLEYLHRTRGFDFTGYKRGSLMRRITKRMLEVNLKEFSDYIDFLEVHPEEFIQLFNTILINVTAFFRDPPAWDYLTQEIIPRILAAKRAPDPIRIWSAGCASGEEPYTLAMVFADALGIEQFRQRVKIYGTDVDEEALTTARHAIYSDKDLEPVRAEKRDKYLEAVGPRYVFRGDIRRAVIFGRHDLVQDAPISRVDLLVCRNALMYFNIEAQGRILTRLHFALNDTGYLFLGRAEMILTHSSLFLPVDMKVRIFSKSPAVNLRERMAVLAEVGNNVAASQVAQQIRLKEVAFDTVPIAQVVVDRNGILAFVNDQARTLFGMASNDIGRPFQDLELSYKPVELRSVIEQAYNERRTITLTDVKRPLPNGELQCLDIQLNPLQTNGALAGMSISFRDETHHNRLQEELQHSKQELETAYEELQSANEELETTNEELQSTVEELQTTNEELQSTNEEMETMNEELQSPNEELQTVNDELRQRTTESNQANFFLQSILSSVRVGIVALDRDLRILLWNERAEDLWGLRADEVREKNFTSLDIGLPIEKLKTPIVKFSDGQADSQEIVVDAMNRRGKTIKCRITFCPLSLGQSGEREGVVMLMEEE
jgi:two-component system CheB/CheR fusion protein